MRGILPLERELEIIHNTPIGMAYDGKEDFSLWREKAKNKLRELLGLDRLQKCSSLFLEEYRHEHESFTEIRFSFQSEENYFVPCILSVPKAAGEKKSPLMICLQGHGTGMHISMGVAKYPPDEEKIKNGDRDFACQCLERGMCALTLEQRNFGERGGNPRPVCHASSLTALLTGRTIIGCRVWDIMRAVDTVTKEYGAFFDADRIMCMGNSGGGTATLYACALEERISAAICSCAFCDFESSIGKQNHCECNYIPGIRKYFDMAEIGGMCTPKPLVIVSGLTDGIFPVEGAKKEFDRLKCNYYAESENPSGCVHVIGQEGHRFYKKEGFEALYRLLGETKEKYDE